MTLAHPVTVIDHPLVQHKLTLLRTRTPPPRSSASLVREISLLLAYEVTRDLPIADVPIETPSSRCKRRASPARSCASSRSCAPATGSSTACWTWCRRRASAISGCIAIRRRCGAVEYYYKLPDDVHDGCASWSIRCSRPATPPSPRSTRLKEARRARIRFVCLIAAPEGLRAFAADTSGRAGVHRRDRPRPERARLHPSRPRRRRRPAVRHEVGVR